MDSQPAGGQAWTPEPVAGLPVWEIDLEVRVEGRQPYEVTQREFAAPQSVQGYPGRGEWDCKVDRRRTRGPTQ